MAKFVNERRVCGSTSEPVGTAGETMVWRDYEVKCHECGGWTRDYGDVSVQAGETEDIQAWLCGECVKAFCEPMNAI